MYEILQCHATFGTFTCGFAVVKDPQLGIKDPNGIMVVPEHVHFHRLIHSKASYLITWGDGKSPAITLWAERNSSGPMTDDQGRPVGEGSESLTDEVEDVPIRFR
jgi:hypothetical protein